MKIALPGLTTWGSPAKRIETRLGVAQEIADLDDERLAALEHDRLDAPACRCASWGRAGRP